MQFLPKDVQAVIRLAAVIAIRLQVVQQATTHVAVALALLQAGLRTVVYAATAVRAALHQAMCLAATTVAHALLHRAMCLAVAVRVAQALSLQEVAVVAEAQAWVEVAAVLVEAVVDVLVVDADKYSG